MLGDVVILHGTVEVDQDAKHLQECPLVAKRACYWPVAMFA